MTLDLPRFERVVCKIVRGLFYYQLGQVVPADRVTRTVADPGRDLISHPLAQYVIAKGVGREVGAGAFEYRVTPTSDVRGTGMAVMLFWQRVLLLSWLMRPETAPPLGGRV